MTRLELSSHTLRAIFQLPEQYQPVRYHAGHMSLPCRYPDLKPESPGAHKTEESVDLQVTLQKGLGRVELLMAGDGPVLEPAYLRQTSRLEPIGRYQIYQEDRLQAGLKHTLVTYAFHADDGAIVGVEDVGESMDKYHFCRRIGKFICVQYSLSKDFGDDFIDIDNRTSKFLKSLLVKAWEIDPFVEE
ncbi:MAG: hypothetical protein JWP36_677 [Paucimonas sp.]|nr:hypothetical protein [Paucimonas sp.]